MKVREARKILKNTYGWKNGGVKMSKTSYEIFIDDNIKDKKFTLVIHQVESDMIIQYKNTDKLSVDRILKTLEFRLKNFLSRKTNTFKTSDVLGIKYNIKYKQKGV